MIACFAPTADAQDPVRPPADSLRPDTTARRDTLSSTDRYLQVDAERRVQLSPLPLVGVDGLLPSGARVVFTRDSIDWAAARTLGDLLERVPGVYLWRGGWLGRAEQPDYLGRGAASVEYFLDGVPLLPVGPDTLAIDASLPALALLDRVEIERGPSLLRIHLFTRRHSLKLPRTSIGVSSGDRSLARYIGSFERRYPSGLGLGLAAEYFGVNAPQGGSGASNLTNGWVQVGWAPSHRMGVQVQAVVQAIDRDTLFSSGVGAARVVLSPAIRGTRLDVQLRGSWRERDDGLGFGVDGFAARTKWTRTDDGSVPIIDGSDGTGGSEPTVDPFDDHVAHDVGTFGGVAGYRQPTWSAQLTAFHHTEWTSLDSRLALGWAPFDFVTGSLELVAQEHDGERDSRWVTARAGVRLPLGVHVGAAASDGRRVALPALSDDPEQRFTDLQATASIERSRYALEGGWVRTDGWQPRVFSQFRTISAVAPASSVDWAIARARLAPLRWLTLESRYEHPLRGIEPDGHPPHHAVTTATIRSKFLRNFPSGTFDLKVQGVVETWSPGVIGRDTSGTAIAIPGRTFVRGILQLQIGPFIAYYDRVNFQGVRAGKVPGYPIPGLGTTFGVRWSFQN